MKPMPTHVMQQVQNLNPIIGYMRSTSPDQWQCAFVRSKDGTRNCVFGHLFNWAEQTAHEHGYRGRSEKYASLAWEYFEELWNTTYNLYPINDGERPEYPQPTARERVIAHLEDLRDRRYPTTHDYMDWKIDNLDTPDTEFLNRWEATAV